MKDRYEEFKQWLNDYIQTKPLLNTLIIGYNETWGYDENNTPKFS
jgi:hypothetical protein